jgi:hypothetical protein
MIDGVGKILHQIRIEIVLEKQLFSEMVGIVSGVLKKLSGLAGERER